MFHKCCLNLLVMISLKLASFLLLTLALTEIQSQNESHYGMLFKNFILTHSKVYASQHELESRFNIFKHNMKIAKDLQIREQGTAVYGATKFSDLSVAEFEQRYLRVVAQFNNEQNHLPQASIPQVKLPKQFDWRKKKIVTPVLDQGLCASAWAIAAVSNIEGLWAIKHKQLLTLSAQELLDCSNANQTCWSPISPQQGYKTIVDLGGLETEADYPYTSGHGGDFKCNFNKSKTLVTISGGVNISRDEQDMAKWLVKNGPIVIRMNAVNALQFYKKGVFHPSIWDCLPGPFRMNHAALIVGFGTLRRKGKMIPYWIVKNSWTSSWAEKGYFKVYRGAGVCGLNTMASSAVL